MKDH